MARGAERSEGFKGSPVVGYVRSAELGDPRLDEWEAEIRRHAVEHGYNLVEVVRDEGVSGVAVWKPGLERAMRLAERRRYVGLIVLSEEHCALPKSARDRLKKKLELNGVWFHDLRKDRP